MLPISSTPKRKTSSDEEEEQQQLYLENSFDSGPTSKKSRSEEEEDTIEKIHNMSGIETTPFQQNYFVDSNITNFDPNVPSTSTFFDHQQQILQDQLLIQQHLNPFREELDSRFLQLDVQLKEVFKGIYEQMNFMKNEFDQHISYLHSRLDSLRGLRGTKRTVSERKSNRRQQQHYSSEKSSQPCKVMVPVRAISVSSETSSSASGDEEPTSLNSSSLLYECVDLSKQTKEKKRKSCGAVECQKHCPCRSKKALLCPYACRRRFRFRGNLFFHINSQHVVRKKRLSRQNLHKKLGKFGTFSKLAHDDGKCKNCVISYSD